MGICPIDSPLVSLGRPGAFRYTKEWTPRKPTVFVNLFNNIWGTNFQQWIGGAWICRVRIWSVEGKGAEADLITPAWEARTPCQAAFFDGPPGKLPPMQSGLELSRKGVLVTAFGPNPGRRRHRNRRDAGPTPPLGAGRSGRRLPRAPAGSAADRAGPALRPPRPAAGRSPLRSKTAGSKSP